jgi:hypothetical protein
VLEDWIWHLNLPPIAYVVLLLAALMLGCTPALSLFVVAGVALILLFTGIHNAWDSVTFIALNQREVDEQQEGR